MSTVTTDVVAELGAFVEELDAQGYTVHPLATPPDDVEGEQRAGWLAAAHLYLDDRLQDEVQLQFRYKVWRDGGESMLHGTGLLGLAPVGRHDEALLEFLAMNTAPGPVTLAMRGDFVVLCLRIDSAEHFEPEYLQAMLHEFVGASAQIQARARERGWLTPLMEREGRED